MERIVHVNGRYLPETEAQVSIFDRGFLFADGVYEVTCVLDGRLVDYDGHMRRLARSLDALDLALPVAPDALETIHRELIARNHLREGMIYLQVTRGPAERDFAFPEDPRPSLVLFTQARALIDTPQARDGICVITLPDIRWGRRDIKTVQLLAPSLAKMTARKAGCADAWMVEDGRVTEATSSNAYIVTEAGTLVTRDLSNAILHGITRSSVLALARQDGTRIEERGFTVEEAHRAREAFMTAASAFVLPVVGIDGHAIGTGRPGPVTRRLREIYVIESRARAT